MIALLIILCLVNVTQVVWLVKARSAVARHWARRCELGRLLDEEQRHTDRLLRRVIDLESREDRHAGIMDQLAKAKAQFRQRTPRLPS